MQFVCQDHQCHDLEDIEHIFRNIKHSHLDHKCPEFKEAILQVLLYLSFWIYAITTMVI